MVPCATLMAAAAVAYRIGRTTTRFLMAEDGPGDFIPVDGGSLAGDKR